MELTPARVEAVISALLQRRQVVLCDVKVSGRLSKPLIQITVDCEDSPITIEQCVKISREVQDLFDSEERFTPDYRLEVSSPGIEAPLTLLWQFRRNIGRVIRLDREGRQIEGMILDVSSEGVVQLDVDGEPISRLAPELSGAKVVLFPSKKSLAKRKRNEARDR